MKKLSTLTALLTIIGLSMPAYSIVDTDQLMSEDYLRNQGYSPETIRIMHLKMVDPYAPHKEKEFQHTPVNYIKKFYQYVDPATDNQNFGEAIIDPRLDWPSKLF